MRLGLVDMPPQTFFDQIYTVAGYPINVEFYLISRAGMGSTFRPPSMRVVSSASGSRWFLPG